MKKIKYKIKLKTGGICERTGYKFTYKGVEFAIDELNNSTDIESGFDAWKENNKVPITVYTREKGIELFRHQHDCKTDE